MIAQPVARVRRAGLVAIVAFGLTGCAGSPEKNRSGIGARAADIALEQVGAPYRYGGNSPGGFDCSGLVQYSYALAGKRIPRTTSGQWAELAPVSDHDMQAGDLLFFRIDGKMSHVGLYLGDSRFVHAPSNGRHVSVESLRSEYYRNAFVRAGRPN